MEAEKTLTSDEASMAKSSNFIKEIIAEDLKAGKNGGQIVTRFPPEPNGYLHIGHAKAFCLDFGLAKEFGGHCNLRLDDTNPTKEDTEYVDAIKEDIHWLGFDWGDHEYFASDYFEQLYEWAIYLIKQGKAYVDDSTAEEIKASRGTLTEPGKPSKYRDRSVEENLDLFTRMRAGEFADGSKVLRAKIDMASPNINLRDPTMYRIRRFHHHRTGDKWCIYPMYDFAHGQSDAIEGVTHSICTLEFEIHRPLYDWFIANLPVPAKPRQIEFARLNLTYTVMSKRKLLKLVQEKYVNGWDDPRMPTIAGLRRRGYTPESIRNFAERIGVAKRDSTVDVALLEHCVRDDLNTKAPRLMAVLHPLKLIIDNYPEGQEEKLTAINNPEDESAGTRELTFGRELFIERDDFMEDPPKKYFRLSIGKEVRLRYGYYVTATSVDKDAEGNITAVHCTYDPATKGGSSPDGRKVKGTIHWVNAKTALSAEVRLYDRLFTKENPEEVAEGEDFTANLNPNSLEILSDVLIEPDLAKVQVGDHVQFERQGYFTLDKDSSKEHLVFNRTVALKDSWAKIAG